jgi:hypothetical protein
MPSQGWLEFESGIDLVVTDNYFENVNGLHIGGNQDSVPAQNLAVILAEDLQQA